MATQSITVNSANYLFNVASIASGDTVKFTGGKKKNVPSLILEFASALRTDSSDVSVDTTFQKIVTGIYNKNKTLVLTFAGNRKVKIKEGLWGFAAKVGGSTFYTEAAWDSYVAANPIGNSINYTLTTSPDTATAKNFFAPKAYTPGGTDLVNTLQNEDVLTGDTSTPGPTVLTGDLGNPNDSGAATIAPSITNVDTINIAFTSTSTPMTLDFQDIAGTETANITRISADLRQTFTNLDADVATLGIANTSEEAKATILYRNEELSSATDTVTLNLNNARLSDLNDPGAVGALNIGTTVAVGSDLQNQIETFNINVLTASTVATFSTAAAGNSYDDLVVGERPQTLNINASAALAIGTLRWLGNRVETNSANGFQVVGLHQVRPNGLGFLQSEQITRIALTGAGNVTLANVGQFTSDADPTADTQFQLDASGLTGRLTADITNVSGTTNPDAFVLGGSAADRFLIDNNNLFTLLDGNGGVDSLTVQADALSAIAPALGSDSVEWLNLIGGRNGIGAVFNAEMTDGNGTTVFSNLTVNNADASPNPLTANLTGLTGQVISVRSQIANGATGNPSTAAAGDVNLNVANAAAAGTVNVQLGSTTDDRNVSNAFSVNNFTNNIDILDTVGDALNLNLEINSAAAGGVDIDLFNQFVSADGLTGTTTITGGATNALTIGLVGSQAYNGAAYNGTQNVEFGTAAQVNQGSNGDETGLNIQTGAQNDVINLQRITTSNVAPPATTAVDFADSAFLRNTVINGGAGVDEVILSANLVDPRVVLVADPTYDAYFANWTGVEDLTFNNFNGVNAVVVGFATQAQEAGLGSNGGNWLTFNDVSATVNVGFEFTRNIGVAANNNALAGNKLLTFNVLSVADFDVTVDASRMGTGAFRNDLDFVSTGANPTNNVSLTYNNIDTALLPNGSFDVLDFGVAVPQQSYIRVQNGGSIDLFDFNGVVNESGNFFDFVVITGDSWTAAGQTSTYDMTGMTHAGLPATDLVVDAANETNGTVVLLGSTGLNAINNRLIGGAGNDTITSGGVNDDLQGRAGNDVITYNGQTAIANTLLVFGGTGDDSVTLTNMSFAVDADISTVDLGAGNDSFVGSAGNDRITGGRNANTLSLGGGADTVVMTTVLNTADTVTGWSAGAVAGTSDFVDISVLSVETEVGGVLGLLDSASGAIGAVTPGDLTGIIQVAGTAFGIADAGNIFRMDTNDTSGVASLLLGSNVGANNTTGAITFAFIDNASDLNIGVANFTTGATGLITGSSATVTQKMVGTYALNDLVDGNFTFV